MRNLFSFFLLFIFTLCENELWVKPNIGIVDNVFFAADSDLKREVVFLSHSEQVVSVVDIRTGEVAWRRVYDEPVKVSPLYNGVSEVCVLYNSGLSADFFDTKSGKKMFDFHVGQYSEETKTGETEREAITLCGKFGSRIILLAGNTLFYKTSDSSFNSLPVSLLDSEVAFYLQNKEDIHIWTEHEEGIAEIVVGSNEVSREVKFPSSNLLSIEAEGFIVSPNLFVTADSVSELETDFSIRNVWSGGYGVFDTNGVLTVTQGSDVKTSQLPSSDVERVFWKPKVRGSGWRAIVVGESGLVMGTDDKGSVLWKREEGVTVVENWEYRRDKETRRGVLEGSALGRKFVVTDSSVESFEEEKEEEEEGVSENEESAYTFRVEEDFIVGLYKDEEVWRRELRNERIVKYQQQDISDTYSKFTHDFTEKYLNPNLLVVVSLSDNDYLLVKLLDVITGNIVLEEKHEGASAERFLLCTYENIVVYHFLNRNSEYQINMIKITLNEAESKVFVRKAFLFPHTVYSMTVSSSLNSILPKVIVLGLSERVVWANIDALPRAPPKKGAPPLPDPPYLPYVFVTQDEKVAAVEGIVIEGTERESTVRAIIRGLDIAVAEFQPAGQFDSLPDEGFMYIPLLLLIAVLFVTAVVVNIILKRKTLKKKWR